MKKLFTFLLFYKTLISCSTSPEGTTTYIPVPPTNLVGIVTSFTQINLSWTDNSTNETGFKIERKTGGGIFSIVGTTTTDITTYSDTGLTPSTTYVYRVYSYNTRGNSPTYSKEITLTTTAAIYLPTLTTSSVSSITSTSAKSGGTIVSNGGAPIIARGVCWSKNSSPTINLSTKTNDGTGLGVFASNLTGLSANTSYYARAYATNSAGTAYGDQFRFETQVINVPGPNISDVDGNIYESVTNCGQTWTKTNLNVSKYRDGTTIPQVTDPAQWNKLTTGAWCYYNNDPANGATYSKLYNWYAIAGIYDEASLNNPSLRKQLAPTGWHIPTHAEWTTLTNCLDGGSVAGGKMKQTGTSLWSAPNTGATNESGFSGLPAGIRDSPWGNAIYKEKNLRAVWWSITDVNDVIAYYYNLNNSTANSDLSFSDAHWKSSGFSVRCIKN